VRDIKRERDRIERELMDAQDEIALLQQKVRQQRDEIQGVKLEMAW
jgi:hypothetical protein